MMKLDKKELFTALAILAIISGALYTNNKINAKSNDENEEKKLKPESNKAPSAQSFEIAQKEEACPNQSAHVGCNGFY